MDTDSDEDSLLDFDSNFKTTASAKKRPRTETTTVTNIDISPEKVKEDQEAKDRQKAKTRVDVRTVPPEIKHPNQLFWYIKKSKGRKGTQKLFPCRKCDKSEGEHRGVKDFDETKKNLVEYLDKDIEMEPVPLGNLVPYHGQRETDMKEGSVEYKWSPELLQQFRKQCKNSKKKDYDDDVGILEAELYLEKVMDTAVEKMKELEEREKSHDHIDFDELISKPPPSDYNSGKDDADSHGSAIVSQVEEGDDYGAASDDENTITKRIIGAKKGTLRVGDILQFYEPNATHGEGKDLKQGVIQKINARIRDHSDICLTMEGGFLLPKNHKVKRVKKIYNNKLKDCSIGWAYVKDYKLIGGILEGDIGTKQIGQELGKIIEKNNQESKQKLKDAGFGHFVDVYEKPRQE
ncbi:predicted protein [Chaetoceros tenuissimus]|uniref:Uncharacterized protein n=1 Tax=Chaetoceros tenuissimus TaxID=426638 RepID=A0AAD3H3E6_9STRA|nr:predicted protein [Chaetoceros tenuissimus]